MMLDTNSKILVIPVHRNVDGMPRLKQHNHSITILVKAKTIKRCKEIFNKIVGGYNDETVLTSYEREHGYNQSWNTKFMELTNDYAECVMYNTQPIVGWDYILFEKFDNKLIKKNTKIIFDLEVSDYLKKVMKDGINTERLLGN